MGRSKSKQRRDGGAKPAESSSGAQPKGTSQPHASSKQRGGDNRRIQHAQIHDDDATPTPADHHRPSGWRHTQHTLHDHTKETPTGLGEKMASAPGKAARTDLCDLELVPVRPKWVANAMGWAQSKGKGKLTTPVAVLMEVYVWSTLGLRDYLHGL